MLISAMTNATSVEPSTEIWMFYLCVALCSSVLCLVNSGDFGVRACSAAVSSPQGVCQAPPGPLFPVLQSGKSLKAEAGGSLGTHSSRITSFVVGESHYFKYLVFFSFLIGVRLNPVLTTPS